MFRKYAFGGQNKLTGQSNKINVNIVVYLLAVLAIAIKLYFARSEWTDGYVLIILSH